MLDVDDDNRYSSLIIQRNVVNKYEGLLRNILSIQDPLPPGKTSIVKEEYEMNTTLTIQQINEMENKIAELENELTKLRQGNSELKDVQDKNRVLSAMVEQMV